MDDIEARLSRLERSLRHSRAAAALAVVLAVAALLVPLLLGERAAPAVPALLTPARFERLSVDHLSVGWLRVEDDSGNAVITMNAGAGGGILSINSAKPQDHNVMLMASPHGASVQVSHQTRPRPFAFLKIMDRKPYLQMYEETPPGSPPKNFYQAPMYMEDGSLSDHVAE